MPHNEVTTPLLKPDAITITGHLQVTVPRPHSLMVSNARNQLNEGLDLIVTTLIDPPKGSTSAKIEPSTITSIELQGFKADPAKPDTYEPSDPNTATINIFFTHP